MKSGVWQLGKEQKKTLPDYQPGNSSS